MESEISKIENELFSKSENDFGDHPLISVIMGSNSDWKIMKECCLKLVEFQIPYRVRIISAHRKPAILKHYLSKIKESGQKIIICGAGMAAHLAGASAAYSSLPVIGVPLKGGTMDGIDALLSTVQMPAGIPVATLALGKAGAINAAIFSLQILSLSDKNYEKTLLEFREKQTNNISIFPQNV